MRGACLLFLCLALGSAAPQAADTPAEFATPALEQRYRTLLDQLRCLVCQNQTLADSHAELAQDLRDELVRQLDAGRSDAEIRTFLVERYGDFVLYRPPFAWRTWLLWLGPFLLCAAALVAIARRGRVGPRAPLPLTDAERQRLNGLLPGSPDEPRR